MYTDGLAGLTIEAHAIGRGFNPRRCISQRLLIINLCNGKQWIGRLSKK
jgi:hypothetical protein